MKIFGNFFEKMSSFWQFFDIQIGGLGPNVGGLTGVASIGSVKRVN